MDTQALNATGCCCENFSAPDALGRTVTRETRRDCCPVHTPRGGSDGRTNPR